MFLVRFVNRKTGIGIFQSSTGFSSETYDLVDELKKYHKTPFQENEDATINCVEMASFHWQAYGKETKFYFTSYAFENVDIAKVLTKLAQQKEEVEMQIFTNFEIDWIAYSGIQCTIVQNEYYTQNANKKELVKRRILNENG